MTRITFSFLALFLAVGTAVFAQEPTLTVINQASDSASVRVVGPTSGFIEIPPGTRQTVAVSGGVYQLKVRYCDGRGHCRFSKTDMFTVTQTSYAVSRITVTLHSVGGNLNERGISEGEFSGT
jgi:hypothetical protein